jgi:YD repeat-containing protein
MRTPAQTGAISIVYYDALNRVIATDIQGFNGCWSRTSLTYASTGYLYSKSRPYFTGLPSGCTAGTPEFTVYADDILGRPTTITYPDTSHSSYGYDAVTTTVTNANSQTTTTVKNAQGLVASTSVVDSNNKTLTTGYVYDAFGDPLTITDPASNQIVNTFDERGRKATSSDPDMGNWTYGYDVLNELTSQTSPNYPSQPTTLGYDVLGRLTSRVEPDMTSTWQYDQATYGVGMIDQATCTGAACAGGSYTRTYTYTTTEKALPRRRSRSARTRRGPRARNTTRLSRAI